jgi:hypothetical protein
MEIISQIDKEEQQFPQSTITKLLDCHELKINPEYENLIVEVSDSEFQKLKESIKEDGMHYLIAVSRYYQYILVPQRNIIRSSREAI